ncbi:type VII secretion-associated serine protease mycosin [Kitasatospora sp. CM 4170]|uniref:Type VII secretion-associated serine protease mycosin n=1 Tax=Kitasatospora aburaviensis TaxID=67265 RepID=A0ABW1F407_9ACTN|nr:type VII secretion-associated serine protease mycosin [Kitasatospora sp. CM 4170]WNM47393.1 type VII secretion-associated serine protease mycosin [Kitasatospora sp. CM 4170]
MAPAAAADSIRAQQWHLDAMHAPEMWKTTKGQGVTVAVVDGGFQLDHPDLVGQFLPGKDFSGLPGGVGEPVNEHGTAMASLIAGSGKGRDGNGAYGLAPGAKILPLKIKTGAKGNAVSSAEFFDQISQAVTYATDQGAKVISISQGMDATYASSDDVAKANNAIAQARSKGALVVASVGNSGQSGNQVEYPGALPYVVGVGAVDQNSTTTAESERGPQVDLVAPGADMIDACPGGSGYCKSHGTSDATAITSASAALVWSVHKDWTANQVLRVLMNTAGKPVDGSARTDAVGYGTVRPRIALTTPGDPGPADVYPIQEKAAEPPAASAPATASSPSASPQSTAPSAAGSPAPGGDGTPVGTPAAQPKADAASDSDSVVPVVAAVAGGLVLVAVVVFLVLRRRGTASAAAPAAPAAAQPGPAAPPVPPAPVGYPPQQGGPATSPPPAYGPPSPPSDNPYAR